MSSTIKSLRRGAVLALALTLLQAAGAGLAFAEGMVVYDPANTAQNVLTAARALQQVNNQIKQLENEMRMLKGLDLQLAPELRDSIAAARKLFGQAQAIRYNLETIAGEVKDLYPEDYQDLGIEDMLKKSDVWIAQSRTSLQHVLEQEARAANGLELTENRTNEALEASAKAEGQTSAIQATNQMLGVLSQQLADMQALQIVQSRALAEEKIERAAKEARATELRRKAFPTERAGAKAAPARSAF